jgi:secreted trypsin-like serine protease
MVLYKEKNVHEIIGVVSYGALACGTENLPGVYTKVFDYITWIRSNLRP